LKTVEFQIFQNPLDLFLKNQFMGQIVLLIHSQHPIIIHTCSPLFLIIIVMHLHDKHYITQYLTDIKMRNSRNATCNTCSSYISVIKSIVTCHHIYYVRMMNLKIEIYVNLLSQWQWKAASASTYGYE
jgi:hypothetical protein